MKRLIHMTFIIGAFLTTSVSYADDIYCKIIGETQGEIVGSSVARLHEGWIPVRSLAGGVTSPYDQPTGLPTGKRQHQPLTITHALDRATPKLFLAAVTNENLTSVDCSFISQGRNARQYFRISLENARIVDMEFSGNSGSDTMSNGTLKLVYERITLTDTINNVSVGDNWQSSES